MKIRNVLKSRIRKQKIVLKGQSRRRTVASKSIKSLALSRNWVPPTSNSAAARMGERAGDTRTIVREESRVISFAELKPLRDPGQLGGWWQK